MFTGKVHHRTKALVVSLLWVGFLALMPGNGSGFTQAQGGAVLRMGFVNVEDVIARMQGSNATLDQLREQVTQTQAQLQDLNDQLAQGLVSQAEFAVRQTQLNNVLAVLNQQLNDEINAQIQRAASQLGQALGLDVITPLRNVVVHGQSVVLQNLTEPVLQALNANLGQGNFDPNGVVASARPLSQVGFFNVDETFIRYKKTAEAIVIIGEKRDSNNEQIAALNAQLNAGEISQAQFDARLAQLNAELEALNQQLTGEILGDISAAAGRLGDALGFHLISSEKNVVLYNNPQADVDLTQALVDLLNAEFEDTSFDFQQVPLPGQAPRKLGVVDADEVFVRFEGTSEAIEQFQAQIASAQQELKDLQAQLDAGQIDEATFLAKRQALETQLATLDRLLTKEITDNILATTRALGQELGFDLITPRKDVVLYHSALVEDLTESVLARMNQAGTQ